MHPRRALVDCALDLRITAPAVQARLREPLHLAPAFQCSKSWELSSMTHVFIAVIPLRSAISNVSRILAACVAAHQGDT